MFRLLKEYLLKRKIDQAVRHSVKKYEKTYLMLADERLKITPEDKESLKK